MTPARCRNDRYRDQPAGFRNIAEVAHRPLRGRKSTAERSMRPATAERSKEIAVGRGGECNEHTRPAVPPPISVRPRSGRIVSPGDNVRRRRCRARRRVACHSGDNATAPRSARSGWGYRGSHGGSLHSPPCDPRLFPSTAPRSTKRNRCAVGGESHRSSIFFASGKPACFGSRSRPMASVLTPRGGNRSRSRRPR